MPDVVIGLTIVAVGTSLPELVTSVRRRGAAMPRSPSATCWVDVFNILGILGITALVRPMAVPAQVMAVDIWVMAATSVLLIVTASTGTGVSRREGWALIGLYVAYWAWLALPPPERAARIRQAEPPRTGPRRWRAGGPKRGEL